MRLHNRRSVLRERLVVLKLGLIGGLLACMMLVVAACDGETQPTGPTVTGESPETTAPSSTGGDPEMTLSPSADTELAGEATWVLESLDGRPVIEGSVITLRIGDNWFDGIDGCNSYGGRSEDGARIAAADGTFTVAGADKTAMLCPEPEGVMDQADAYITALVQGEKFRITDDRLEILDSSGAARLVFVRQAPLSGSPMDLEGTAWRLLEEGDTDGDVRAPTMVFLDDRLLTGVTACRPYAAFYRTSNGNIRFPAVSMLTRDESSCPDESRTLQYDYTDFLTWAREYSVDEEGGSSLLRIWSIRGKTLTFEPLPRTVEDIADAEWTLWKFIEIRQDVGVPQDSSVIEGTEVTISFGEDSLGGSSGCNSYGGPAKVEDGSVTVDRQSFFSTAKLCEGPDGLIEQEKRYFSLVQRATRYGIYGDGLFMQTDDDVFLLFQARSSQTGDTPSPTATPPPVPIPWDARGRISAPPHGPGAESGTAYPYALYVHCGVRDARFDGRLWMADPMLSDGSGNPPPDWAPADSVGVMELVNDDLAVFTADSGRIIEFKPWPSDVEWRPCQ